MKYFNVPADFKEETIDRYAALNKKYRDSKVTETYGQITVGNSMGSGRAYDLIPKVDIGRLKSYIEYSKEKDIAFNYTLNATCIGNREFSAEGAAEITAFLDRLYDAGVRSLTVTLPSLMELIRLKGYDFEIKASTVCQIINANKAEAFKKMGVDKIVIDESINRDFETLRRIRNTFGEKVEVITNVICHKNCVYEMFHHNQTSHDSGTASDMPSSTYYSHRCMMKRCESPETIMKLAWIRPEDIQYYVGIGINYFKLQGRQAVMKGDPVRTVECYCKESYDGNLMELLDMFSPTNSFSVYIENGKMDGFIKPFYEIPNFCKNDCVSCSYCENFAKKHTDYKKVGEIFDTANEFYSNYDQYINMVKNLETTRIPYHTESPVRKLFGDQDIDLDFDLDKEESEERLR